MAIKTRCLIWSCMIVIAVNCNGFDATPNLAEDCEFEESKFGSTGYHASGSAHSSQYLLPDGSVVTSSKGSSYTSDGGIKNTFHQLKQEADRFVSKQTDTLNIPNVLPPLHTGFDQDLQTYGFGLAGSQSQFNKQQSGSQQKQIYSSGSAIQGGQTVYEPIAVPPVSKVITTKKEKVVSKKVITHGSGFAGNDDVEVNQNGLDANVNTDDVYYQAGNNKEIETLDSTNTRIPLPQYTQKIQIKPVVGQQNSYNQFSSNVKQSSSSQVVPGIPAYIPNNVFTTGIVDFTSNDNSQVGSENLRPIVSIKVPYKVTKVPETHYQTEEKETNHQNTLTLNSETNTQQKEHKYTAVPVIKTPDVPIKIKYMYDGKTLTKAEEYSSGLIKPIPISVEETETIMKEIHQRHEAAQTQSQSYGVQPGYQPELSHDGYYYPAQPQTVPSSKVKTYEKQSSQSSHSQQTITSNGGDVQVEQFSHLPLQVDSQKQYLSGYNGVVPPLGSASQIKNQQKTQTSQIYTGNVDPSILVRGVPQTIVFPAQQTSSSSSGSSFHSSSQFAGSGGEFVFPSDILTDAQAAGSAGFDKFASFHDNIAASGIGSVPLKNSYGVSTSFSSSSSNINGKKSENRHASVTVNDNGKVDTYNVKS